MRLSASNIAWDRDEDGAVSDMLAAHGIDQVDLAPSKYFASPADASDADIARVRHWWNDRGFTIAGMQSLLFGTSGLNLFSESREAMLDHLKLICRIGGGLGARALTFGSPRQRDRTGLSDAEAEAIAIDFFGRLGDHAVGTGVIICLEPNPPVYGCNFMTTTDEAAAIVSALGHPAVRLQLDVGAIAINDEPVEPTIARHAAFIGHVHASEPQLITLGDGGAPHAEAAAALRAHRPDLTVTIEMVASSSQPHITEILRATELARLHYGGPA